MDKIVSTARRASLADAISGFPSKIASKKFDTMEKVLIFVPGIPYYINYLKSIVL